LVSEYYVDQDANQDGVLPDEWSQSSILKCLSKSWRPEHLKNQIPCIVHNYYGPSVFTYWKQTKTMVGVSWEWGCSM